MHEATELVTAAIIERDGRVLLGRRSPSSKLAGGWEFPGGKVQANETPEQCLVRELEEELQITVEITGLFLETEHHYEHGSFHIIAFRTDWISGELTPQVHDRLEWVKVDEIDEYQLLAADIPIGKALQSAPTN